jgi:crotonobetainyl-CoA:carnitine CoA-transferase CaiB-like acyl-CoA transferase
LQQENTLNPPATNLQSTAESEAQPLAGVKVIEICSTIAGPACGRLLADFGADVIKIEPPQGDPVRQMGSHVGDISLYAASILRNKRSVVIDLKTEQGCKLALALMAGADIVLENNRPGVLERLGLGYEQVSAQHPGIIFVRISGYGQDGPYAQRPGYGAICEAVGGVRHMTGDPDRPPARVALATTDYLTSVYAAFGAMGALRSRDRTGQGQVVDVALYETAFTQLEPLVPAYQKLNKIPMRVGPNLPSMAPNSLYPTRDNNYLLIAANSNATFERLLKLMDRLDLLQDTRFCSIRARGQKPNMTDLDAIISTWTRQYDAVELEQMIIAVEVPVSRVYTIADIFDDPHYRARGMIANVPHPQLESVAQVGIVPRLSVTPGSIRFTGPDLGADTVSVLRDELGIDDKTIEDLLRDGVIAAGD